MNLTANLQTILGLVDLGVAVGSKIVAAVRAGRLEVVKDGVAVTPEELEAEIAAAQKHGLATGDAAADRIEGRHVDDDTGNDE